MMYLMLTIYITSIKNCPMKEKLLLGAYQATFAKTIGERDSILKNYSTAILVRSLRTRA